MLLPRGFSPQEAGSQLPLSSSLLQAKLLSQHQQCTCPYQSPPWGTGTQLTHWACTVPATLRRSKRSITRHSPIFSAHLSLHMPSSHLVFLPSFVSFLPILPSFILPFLISTVMPHIILSSVVGPYEPQKVNASKLRLNGSDEHQQQHSQTFALLHSRPSLQLQSSIPVIFIVIWQLRAVKIPSVHIDAAHAHCVLVLSQLPYYICVYISRHLIAIAIAHRR
ncbi:hypothetical protein F5884DRAFT_881642 [Xylogone sp. PMI_703]|nr:hypothetical protein F5884DRAFT_881642 [Xylogone sp. PMI_703]